MPPCADEVPSVPAAADSTDPVLPPVASVVLALPLRLPVFVLPSMCRCFDTSL